MVARRVTIRHFLDLDEESKSINLMNRIINTVSRNDHPYSLYELRYAIGQ